MSDRTVTLIKGRERFALAYESGAEKPAIAAIEAWRDAGLIDGFDVAILVHQVGVRMLEDCGEIVEGMK